MGHDPLYGVALILRPLLVCLSRYELPKVGVANKSAGHPTLLEKGCHMFTDGSLRKSIAVVLHKELTHSRVSEGRPYFRDVAGHVSLHCWVHTQHGGAVLSPLVLRDQDDPFALANPGGLVVGFFLLCLIFFKALNFEIF